MKKITLKLVLITLLFTLISSFSTSSEPADRLKGVWEPSNGRSRIKIEKIGNKFYGKIVWLKEPNDPTTKKPKVDKNNPDTAMRNVPLKGYRILKDFTYKGKDEWENGTIYDPENGTTYNCVITMKDTSNINIRGYVGIKTFGRTDTWKKVTVKK